MSKMFITHFSFITHYPEVSQQELEENGGAIVYFRQYNKKQDQDEADEQGDYEQRIRRIGLSKKNGGYDFRKVEDHE